MARKRMIDPNFWQSEDISKLSHFARLVFIGLFSNADDEGRGRAKPAYLKSILFPYDESLRIAEVDNALNEQVQVLFKTPRGGKFNFFLLTLWWDKGKFVFDNFGAGKKLRVTGEIRTGINTRKCKNCGEKNEYPTFEVVVDNIFPPDENSALIG